MGCLQSKKSKETGFSNAGNKENKKDLGAKKELDVNCDYLFVIKEESANNEESAFPSRIQSHKNY